ncbi:gluconolaconase [Burkholderia cenocepacia]|nr:gluconolaconase [Burkholderia cenocepacia]WJN72136.1 hypothetical protein OH687_39065 [Burkholderia anthina]
MLGWRPSLLLLLGITGLWNLSSAATVSGDAPELQTVARFDHDQPAGIAVSNEGRIFVTFPRHTGHVDFTVGEVKDGQTTPFPDLEINTPDPARVAQTLFSVQSLVIDHADRLWMLDIGVMKVGEPPLAGAPKLVVVDLALHRTIRTIQIPAEGLVKNSALKDFRLDFEQGTGGVAFITDSAPGAEALIVLDLASGKAMRRLSGSVVGPGSGPAPIVEGSPLMVQPKGRPPRPFAVGLNGVELSRDHSRLYFNAFTGRRLFDLPARDIANPAVSEDKLRSEVSDDGVIGIAGHLALDASGNLYVMDMERNAIFRHASDGTVTQLVSSPMLLWPDTMAVSPQGDLYVTSSQHNRGPSFHDGVDLRQRPFALYRIHIGAGPVRP